MLQIGVHQNRAFESAAVQDGMAKISASEVRAIEVSPQLAAGKVRACKVSRPEIDITKCSPGQVRASEIRPDIRVSFAPAIPFLGAAFKYYDVIVIGHEKCEPRFYPESTRLVVLGSFRADILGALHDCTISLPSGTKRRLPVAGGGNQGIRLWQDSVNEHTPHTGASVTRRSSARSAKAGSRPSRTEGST